ncbi:MAG TPA: ATP-binding protein [Candidatus Binataceae bacterium]|nr:ATP-binding protein [Candidatus Binataceae bacterium]
MADEVKVTDAAREAELKRRRRELIAVGVAAAVLVAFVLAQTELPPLSRHTSLVSNLVVILLFDLSFLLLGLLLLLVGRNLAKVIFEHRRGLIGSKFQVRLVLGFIAVALVPSAFLLVVAGAFLHADVGSWFNPEYERVLDDSLDIAKVYYLNSANNAAHFARVLAGEIAARGLLKPDQRAALKTFVEQRQQEYNLGTIEVFDRERRLLLLALSPKTPTGIGVAPESPLLAQTLSGHATTRTDSLGKSDIIRGSAPIYTSADSDAVIGAVVVDYFLPRSLAQRAAGISKTFEDYSQLRILHQPILHSYFLALTLIGLVVVLLASWFGMFLARGVTGPIKLLAEGTQAIAHGELDYQIPSVGDDEIGQLVLSFNRMTADLRASRAELERRRSYTETLLRNVSAGVIGLDEQGTVTAINPCAERMLGLKAADALGSSWRAVFRPALAQALDEIFAQNRHPHEAHSSLKLEPFNGGGEHELMVTASALGESGELGTVLFLEDVSQLAKVERMEAWREVARRIAHEIKNPLTPIQLSAERLRRQLAAGADGEAGKLLEECTRTIISEVEDLKRLVAEFSAFARMPHLNPVPGHLNPLVEETAATFRETNPGVEFAVELAPTLPRIAIDREALKRALVNLMENAVYAARTANPNGGERARVELRTAFDALSGVVTLEVCDNGPGIAPAMRSRIFEPYFSTRKGGTGLGLAIVSAIVADHHGFVRVRERAPRGSRFVLEFPIKDQQFANVLS